MSPVYSSDEEGSSRLEREEEAVLDDNEGQEVMAAIQEAEERISLEDPDTENAIQRSMEELKEVVSEGSPRAPRKQHGIGASSAEEKALLKRRLKVLDGGKNPLSGDEEEFTSQQYRRKNRAIRLDSLKLSKFDGSDNFSLWSNALLTILELAGLKDIMIGKESRPKEGSRSDLGEWDYLDCQARAILQVYLVKAPLQLISGCETAAEAWKVLKDTYMRESRANKAHLIQEYESFSMGHRMSMESYIQEVKALIDRLRGVGVVLEDEMMVIKLLRGLREEFDVERKIISSSENLNFAEVCARLQSDALMSKKSYKDSPQANAASERQRPPKRKNGASGKGSYCYICGDSSHISPQCPHKKPGGGKVFVCYKCKKPGHKSADCRSKTVGDRAGSGSSSEEKSGTN